MKVRNITTKPKKGLAGMINISGNQLAFGVLVATFVYAIYLITANKFLNLSTVMTINENEIEEFNSMNTWKRGGNSFFDGTSLSDAKSLINTSFASHSNLARCKVIYDSTQLPDNYHFHKHVPRCGARVANQQSKIYNYQAPNRLLRLRLRLCCDSDHQ